MIRDGLPMIYDFREEITQLERKILSLKKSLNNKKRNICKKLVGKKVTLFVRPDFAFYDEERVTGILRDINSNMVEILINGQESSPKFKLFSDKEYCFSYDEIVGITA